MSKPLTIEELKNLKADDYVWLVYNSNPKDNCYVTNIRNTPKMFTALSIKKQWRSLRFEMYEKTWLAYKNKEMAEAETESVVEEYINELEAKKEYYKQECHYWYGQANRNYEDCHNGWTEQTTKKVAKAIYEQVDEWRKSPELDPRDSYDCNALDAYNNVCKYICRTYGIEVDDE